MVGNFYEWTKSRWNNFSWSGPKRAPFGEQIRTSSFPSVDYSNPKEKSISTTITCYVTGTYIDDRGKMFTIRERYSIDVTYSNSTIIETMTRIRSLLIQKFSEDNPSFNVSDIFIPELVPEIKRLAEPMFMYKGGKIYRYMTRMQEGEVMLGAEKDIYKSRAEKILKQYGLKRKEALIKRL
jgi:hypothetical protein